MIFSIVVISSLQHITTSSYAGLFFFIYIGRKCTSLAPALYRRSIVYPNISDEQSSISVSSLYIKSAFSSKLSILLSISIALNTPGSSYSLLPAPYPVFFIEKCCGSAVSVLTAATIAAPVGVTSSPLILALLNSIL